MVFGCKSIGTSKGYGERETSLATLGREGGGWRGVGSGAHECATRKQVAPGALWAMRIRKETRVHKCTTGKQVSTSAL